MSRDTLGAQRSGSVSSVYGRGSMGGKLETHQSFMFYFIRFSVLFKYRKTENRPLKL